MFAEQQQQQILHGRMWCPTWQAHIMFIILNMQILYLDWMYIKKSRLAEMAYLDVWIWGDKEQMH